MAKGVVVLLWVVGAVVVLIVASRVLGAAGLKRVMGLSVKEADLAALPDGTYRGSYSGGRFSNTVEVQVANHQITGIRVIKDITFRMSSVREQLFNLVREKQSLSVDTVSGATATTKAYLKAIEDALKGAGD